MADQDFLHDVTRRLAALPGVRAVTLGGSRALGTARPDSDWDLGLYYRDGFHPDALRAIGWPGEVSQIGDWGGGVFNGGAWLEIDGHRVDVHYRDLAVVEDQLAEARAGRFHIEPLMFHLAGIPSYLVVAELAINRVLSGTPPRPDGYPDALRRTARERWWETARLGLTYAAANNAPRGQRTEVAGAIAVAACRAGHAVLAARGEWITNDKTLLDRAGLREVDAVIARLAAGPAEPAALRAALDEAGAPAGERHG
ncbi:nucleotidyltransferase domain-containing protein [Spongiactinospora sp. 9N601]|uniref:nucleotidyltransferase domain-containing protein n=1 Tax=Spongiactinospora sp. 9N601 TaxID=3375149 RepID=UPI0037BA0C83